MAGRSLHVDDPEVSEFLEAVQAAGLPLEFFEQVVQDSVLRDAFVRWARALLSARGCELQPPPAELAEADHATVAGY